LKALSNTNILISAEPDKRKCLSWMHWSRSAITHMQQDKSLKSENATQTNQEYTRFHLSPNRFSSMEKHRIAEHLHSQQPAAVIGSPIETKPVFWPLNRITIEAINICNYRCPLCRTNLKDWVPRGAIELETVQNIITPLTSGLKVVNLYGTRGEPLLHPRLESIVGYVKSASKAKIRISTNGSLVSKSRARGLLDAGLDQIVFAVDGLTQRSYSAYRRGGNLDRVVENLRRFCELKVKGGYSTRVIFQFIPMAKNEHEVPQVAAFAYALGVDVVKLKYSTSAANSESYRVRDAAYRPDLGSNKEFVCPQGMDNIYIDPNGYCYPCCYMEGYPNLFFGNAKTESIVSIWNDPKIWELRRSFAEQLEFNPFCRTNCYGVARFRKEILKK